jgi:DNA-binding GntR family transcriptional regulator
MLINLNKSTSNIPSKLSPLVSTTLADQVADRIVDAIIAREFVSGTRLIETELASALHVSRVPVREAIRILESQGLIVAAPQRGMQVGQFDATWAQQLHETRVAMEQVCARHVSSRLRKDKAAREKMEICLENIVTARSSGDWSIINVVDLAFHTALFDLAESPLLLTLWTAIARHVRIMFSIETYRDQDFERIVAEHQNYLSVLLKGSNAEIVNEIRSHVAGRKLFAEAKN